MVIFTNIFICAKRIFWKVCITGATIPAEKLRKFNLTAEQYRNTTENVDDCILTMAVKLTYHYELNHYLRQ